MTFSLDIYSQLTLNKLRPEKLRPEKLRKVEARKGPGSLKSCTAHEIGSYRQFSIRNRMAYFFSQNSTSGHCYGLLGSQKDRKAYNHAKLHFWPLRVPIMDDRRSAPKNWTTEGRPPKMDDRRSSPKNG